MLGNIRPRSVQRGATRQRADFAGSRRAPIQKNCALFRQGRVAGGFCGACHTAPPAPNPGEKSLPRHGDRMNVNRP